MSDAAISNRVIIARMDLRSNLETYGRKNILRVYNVKSKQ